jgi:hypothetical protein
MIRAVRLGLLALVAVTGCTSSPTYDVTYAGGNFVWVARPVGRPVDPPRLGLSDDQISKALTRQHLRASKRHEEALEVVARSQGGDTASVLSATLECYALADRDAADQLANGKHGVYNFDAASSVATIDCNYRSRNWTGVLEVTVHRKPGVEGPLAICFPPGSFGAAIADGDGWTRPDDDRRYGHWPSQQDLAFLRAPAVYLGEGENEGTIDIPIACASFQSGPPQPDQAYGLHRFEPDSSVDRLLIALCAREETSEPEAQLAMWLTRNDITWDDFCSKGGAHGSLITFGTGSRILPRHAKGAARLILEAGSNPQAARFFGGVGLDTLDERPVNPPKSPSESEKPADATP